MTKQEIKYFVEIQIDKGVNPVDAISNILLELDLEVIDPILWYQQTIGGE